MSDNQLFNYTIRVPKKDSAFLYFQLEANEGLCFYSTLESSLGQPYRDIEIKGHTSLETEFLHVAKTCKAHFL